jgi:bacteriorhodopsin
MVDAVSVTKILWAYYAVFLLGGTGQWEDPFNPTN